MAKKGQPLNMVNLPDGRSVHWYEAFPRDFAEQFRDIPQPLVPEYRQSEDDWL